MGFVHLCVCLCKPSGLFGMWSMYERISEIVNRLKMLFLLAQ